MERIRGEYVTCNEAAELLGVSRFHISRLIKRERLTVYEAHDDRRVKWLRWEDVVRLATPVLVSEIRVA